MEMEGMSIPLLWEWDCCLSVCPLQATKELILGIHHLLCIPELYVCVYLGSD